MEAFDWSGSGSERREQRGCKPPAVEAQPKTHFVVKRGAHGHIKKTSSKEWKKFTTQHENTFVRQEYTEDGKVVFQINGWQLRVWREDVTEIDPNVHAKRPWRYNVYTPEKPQGKPRNRRRGKRK